MDTFGTVPRRRQHAGFSLIELLITVAIVGILASVALPLFMDSNRKSHRSDAFTALSSVQQAQERWRSNKPSYADDTQLTALPTASPPGLGQSSTSAAGYYAISISDADATGYTVKATAVSGQAQAQDAGCQVMAIRSTGGNLVYGSGASTATFPDPNHCWAR